MKKAKNTKKKYSYDSEGSVQKMKSRNCCYVSVWMNGNLSFNNVNGDDEQLIESWARWMDSFVNSISTKFYARMLAGRKVLISLIVSHFEYNNNQ